MVTTLFKFNIYLKMTLCAVCIVLWILILIFLFKTVKCICVVFFLPLWTSLPFNICNPISCSNNLFFFPQREEVCIWFHLSVCLQSSVHSFQDIIFKFCVMIDTSDNLSGFHFDENRVKDQSIKTLYYPQFSMDCLHTSQQ